MPYQLKDFPPLNDPLPTQLSTPKKDKILDKLGFSFRHGNIVEQNPLFHSYYADGYVFISETFFFKRANISSVGKTLANEGFNLELGSEDNSFTRVFTKDDKSKVILVRDSLTVISKNLEDYNNTLNLLGQYDNQKDYFKNSDSIIVEIHYTSARGPTSMDKTIEKSEIEHIYPELYPEYDIEKLLEQFKLSKENILLLYGSPGTGKTSFIKYAFPSFDTILYTKDTKIVESAHFWESLHYTSNNALVILDDLDSSLAPRDKKSSNAFMSNLLSFSDGVFRNNVKFIITTNMEVDTIDSALIRPGRLFDFLKLSALTNQQAKDFWVNIAKLPEQQFNKLFKDKETVTQAALISEYNRAMSGVTDRTYNKIGPTQYMLEDKLAKFNISTDKTKRKLGFV